MTLAPRYAETHLVGVSTEVQDMETRFAVAVRQRELLESYIRERLKPGHHFYKVRDGSKNSLTKEGAELVCLPHGYQPMYFKEGGPDAPPEDNKPFQLTIRCRLMRGDLFAGEGMGSASSWLTDRDGQRKPRFRDPGLCHNATLKMAQKSAYIAATLNATAASEFFTQDMEDAEGEIVAEQHPPTPKDNRYYCSEHGVNWFKRGSMKGYAHPIGNTGKWCPMKDAKLAHPPEQDQDITPEEQRPSREDLLRVRDAIDQRLARPGSQEPSSTHTDTEEAPSKDGPSGAAAEFEALVLSLLKPTTVQILAANAKRLGYVTPESIRAVVGPSETLVNQEALDAAQHKLIQASLLRRQEASADASK